MSDSVPESPAQPAALAHPLPAGMRDLLPAEARRQSALARRVMHAFELHGFERVSLPAFEYADVLERGLGALGPDEVLRFVEPETGEVVALRPDMTPQVARLLATRLADVPGPCRLCYEGSVLRRRRARARRHRQIPQAGIELIGLAAPRGDLEVLEVAVFAMRAAGLDDFVLDLAHARVAGSLIDRAPEPARRELVEALALKDSSELERRAASAGLEPGLSKALAALPDLHGGEPVWQRAEGVLAGTPAEPALCELRQIWDQAAAAGMAGSLLVDFGETRHFAYYSGLMFQILAEGPGEAVGSGGRYDGLLAKFGAPRPAAGFAIDLDNLGWALATSRAALPEPPRVLVSGGSVSDQALLLAALRSRGVPAASAPNSGSALDYARAWRYGHVVELTAGGALLVAVAGGAREEFSAAPAEIGARVAARLAPATVRGTA